MIKILNFLIYLFYFIFQIWFLSIKTEEYSGEEFKIKRYFIVFSLNSCLTNGLIPI
jgi:hypothetical protein